MHDFKNIMARTAIALVMTISAISVANAQVVKDELSFGGKLGYVTENESASLSAFFQYAFSSRFRIAPEIGYIIRNNDKQALTVDFNAHLPLDFTGEQVAFYPLAGLNFSSWECHYLNEKSGKDSHSFNRVGLNLGAGFELRCSSKIKLLIEAKYCIVKNFSSAQIAAGVSYTI